MNSLLLALILSQTRYTPAEAQSLFTEANEAYSRQDFQTAQARYEALVTAGLGNATVLFNLGTTHLARGQLGHAVLYLERAYAQSHDEDIEANLAVARQKQGDQVVGADVSVPFLQRLAGALNVQALGVAFLVMWYLGFAFALVAWQRASARWWLGLAAALFLGVGSVLGTGVAVHAYVSRTVIEGVVIPQTIKVLELPSERARVSFEVHAGLKVRIVDETGQYVRIRLPNALEGWAEKGGVAQL